MDDARNEVVERIVDTFLAEVLEHSASVQVFITLDDADETSVFHRSGGNFFASYGAIDLWLIRQKAITKARVMREVIEEDRDGDTEDGDGDTEDGDGDEGEGEE